MKMMAMLLLIVGLTKLCFGDCYQTKMEVKELVYNTPILVDVSPEALAALITADGLICTFSAIMMFCL